MSEEAPQPTPSDVPLTPSQRVLAALIRRVREKDEERTPLWATRLLGFLGWTLLATIVVMVVVELVSGPAPRLAAFGVTALFAAVGVVLMLMLVIGLSGPLTPGDRIAWISGGLLALWLLSRFLPW